MYLRQFEHVVESRAAILLLDRSIFYGASTLSLIGVTVGAIEDDHKRRGVLQITSTSICPCEQDVTLSSGYPLGEDHTLLADKYHHADGLLSLVLNDGHLIRAHSGRETFLMWREGDTIRANEVLTIMSDQVQRHELVGASSAV